MGFIFLDPIFQLTYINKSLKNLKIFIALFFKFDPVFSI